MGCSCSKGKEPNRAPDYQCARLDDTAASTRCRADICGSLNTKYIIQSGTHYIEVCSLKEDVYASDVKPLPQILKNGDHYLARRRKYVEYVGGKSSTLSMRRKTAEELYVIKGSSCILIALDQLLTIDYDPGHENIFELHPKCRGGDFYFANNSGFYIIHLKDNTYLQVQDMSIAKYKSDTAICHKLHESFKNGLYYFATEDNFYILKESAEFGLVYHRAKDLRSNEFEEVLTVSPSIVKFMQNSPLDQQG